jgi:N-acetylmuramoyl-L-alanine amidase
MIKIVLDPGHGGDDPGAVGPNGLRESDAVLEVAQQLHDLLHGVAQVVLTRTGDEYVSLSGRADIANELGADLFLSIHANAAENRNARGHEVWTTPGTTGADAFATSLFEAYCREFPDLPARKDVVDGDPDKEARFTVLTRTHCPAALYELEFISSVAGERMLGDVVMRDRMAEALCDGILAHLGVEMAPAPQDNDAVAQHLHEATESISAALEALA